MDFKVEAKFQANSLKELRDQITAFMAEEGFELGYTIAISDEPVVKAKPTKAAKSEAKVETAPLEPAPSVVEESTAIVEEPSAKDAETSASTDLTYEDLRASILGLAGAKGPEAVKAVLATFGLTTAKDTAPDMWPKIYAAIEEAK